MSAAAISAEKENNRHNHFQRSRSMFRCFCKNDRGFTLVEVIVVAVIVAVLSLVGVQLYQGYVNEARRNTAENLAASATSYLQTFVNARGEGFVTEAHFPNLTGPAPWKRPLNPLVDAEETGDSSCVTFMCPANAQITVNHTTGLVTAIIDPGVASTGEYYYKEQAATP